VAASTISEEDEKFPLLAARAESVIDFRDVLGLIRRAILPSGEISDDASPELRKIRANIWQTRDSIQKSLKQILRARNAEAGEDYVTLRNDRFVIPVRSEHRRGVQGLFMARAVRARRRLSSPSNGRGQQSTGAVCGRGSDGDFPDFTRADGTIADGAWRSFQLWIRLQSWTVRSRERVLLGILMPRFQNLLKKPS